MYLPEEVRSATDGIRQPIHECDTNHGGFMKEIKRDDLEIMPMRNKAMLLAGILLYTSALLGLIVLVGVGLSR